MKGYILSTCSKGGGIVFEGRVVFKAGFYSKISGTLKKTAWIDERSKKIYITLKNAAFFGISNAIPYPNSFMSIFLRPYFFFALWKNTTFL